MVKVQKCLFCGHDIEPGTGMMYVQADGSFKYFCSSKCRKNSLALKRKPRKLKWTTAYQSK
ncbi:MAG: 50S ribosomal protein L24e [Promethearchaeota archaeon]